MAKVIILTGAGVSAESGISTFRDSDGLWKNHRIEDICIKGCLQKNRKKVIEFYNTLRVGLKDKIPNHAHKVIANLKNIYKDDIAVITQNVDDMFERVECKNTIHLHGFLKEIYCTYCGFIKDIGYDAQDNESFCPKCKHLLRPNIVFFGEDAPLYEVLYKELETCELLVVIGTSGYVIQTDDFLYYCPSIKQSILNNLEPSDNIDDSLYSKVIYKEATSAIDEIEEEIKSFFNKTC